MVSYKCSVCDYFCLSKDDLNSHMRAHYSEQQYECYLCDKRFSNQKTLELHMTIHATEVKYETYASTSGQQVFSSGISNTASTSQIGGNVPQVKVRVKTFPENAVVLKEPYFQPQLSENELQFQLHRDEFTVVDAPQAYISQEEEIFPEKKPIQFKMWTKEHSGNPSADAVNKSPFVVRVIDHEPESQRIVESNNDRQNEQPIRIFVGSNIRLENLEDLNNFTPLGEEFQTDGLPQVNFSQDQTYSYGYEDQSQSQGNSQPLQVMKDGELPSLQEVIEEGDLVSIQDEIGAENLQSLAETMADGNFQAQKRELSSNGMKSCQEDAASSSSFLADDVTDGKKGPFNLCASQGYTGETVESKCVETIEKSQNGSGLNQELPFKEFASEVSMQGEKDSSIISEKERREVTSNLDDEVESNPDDPPPLPLHEEGDGGNIMKASEKSGQDDETNQVLIPLQEKSINKSVDNTESFTSLTTETDVPDVCPAKMRETVVESDETALKPQIIESSKKPYKCEVCGMGFRFSFLLNNHMRTTHSQLEDSNSTECCKFYKKLKSMHLIEEQDPSKIYYCSECREELCSAYELKIHMNKHRKIGNHECGLCFLKFKNCQRYHSHLKSHLVYKCYICDKLLKDPTRLNMHLQSHLKKKLFECKTCQRVIYCHPKEFYRHELMHQFVMWCPYCCKNISSKDFHKHKLKCARLLSKYTTNKENLSNVQSRKEVSDTKRKRDLMEDRTKVVELLIDDLLEDMSEDDDDAKEDSLHFEMDDWVNKTSECITNEKFRNNISKCSTRNELLKELSSYSQSDIIKDAVSDLYIKERTAVQRLVQYTDMNENIESGSTHGLKRKRNE